VLWAFNPQHLQYLRGFVAAKDRRIPPRKATDPLNAIKTQIFHWDARCCRDDFQADVRSFDKRIAGTIGAENGGTDAEKHRAGRA